MAMLKEWLSPWRGTTSARRMHDRLMSNHHGLTTGLEQLVHLCPPSSAADEEHPIFLLSAGWRSGSTLLQRLLMSGTDTLIWGEPYDECGMIQALANSLRAFRPDWPPPDYYYDGTPPGHLTGSWIANLFPALEDLRAGHRALFERTFAAPARQAGAKRWGLKEVRLTADHAAYLRWLFPRARFLFLYRNPLDAYRSYNRYGRNWYDTFPDRPVFTPKAFGQHWQSLVEGYLQNAESLDALLIRYEDISGQSDAIERIEAYLGMKLDRSTLRQKIGSSDDNGRIARISIVEHRLLKRAVSPLADTLGYSL